ALLIEVDHAVATHRVRITVAVAGRGRVTVTVTGRGRVTVTVAVTRRGRVTVTVARRGRIAVARRGRIAVAVAALVGARRLAKSPPADQPFGTKLPADTRGRLFVAGRSRVCAGRSEREHESQTPVAERACVHPNG